MFMLGHSYIRRLTDFMERSNRRNLGLDRANCTVGSLSIGGSQVSNPHRFRQFVDAASGRNHAVVYIHLGEVDLMNGARPELVTDRLCHLTEILAASNSSVVVSQLLYPPHVSREQVVRVNRLLKQRIRHMPRVHLWRHRGFWSSDAPYHVDGVHLSEFGLRKYFHSVRVVVEQRLKER